MSHTPLRSAAALLLGMSILTACSDDGTAVDTAALGDQLDCTIPSAEIFDGGPGKDGIPALTNPNLVGVADQGAAYLRDEDRVIAVELNGQAVAVPLNVGWWHEIVNLTVGGRSVAVTHCPLTGSSLVFDRQPLGNVAFGVSGLLYRNNLIMYDRSTRESLWPQMLRAARCGAGSGTTLQMVPAIEMRWDAFRALYANGRVISDAQGFARDYRDYPYGAYADLNNPRLLFPLGSDIDARRPPKERVLGIPVADGGIALPFGELARLGTTGVVRVDAANGAAVVFWNSPAEAAMAFDPRLDGTPLTFRVGADGIVDEQTGSAWRVTGEAVSGPLTGKRLTAVAEAYVAYWFAWAAFHPTTSLWRSR